MKNLKVLVLSLFCLLLASWAYADNVFTEDLSLNPPLDTLAVDSEGDELEELDDLDVRASQLPECLAGLFSHDTLILGCELDLLPQKQLAILSASSEYVKPFGTLVYSTCTINEGENGRIAEFIEKDLGLAPDPLAGHLPGEIPGININQLQLLPHIHGTDGFYLARFVKR